MAINTQDLFDFVSAKYSATTQSQSFQNAFFFGLIRIGLDLDSSKVGVTITIPTELETNIDCDDDYLPVFVEGLNKYIQETGMWGQDDQNTLDTRYERALRKAHTYYKGTQDVSTKGSE